MTSIRNATSLARKIGQDPCDEVHEAGAGPGAGGPVAAMHAELSASLNAADYERWLLPPEPRDDVERMVHALSLAAGVLAMTSGLSLIWLLV